MTPKPASKTAKKDLRSPEARARDAYMKDNPACDATTLNAPASHTYYLSNRIERAFIDGIECGKALASRKPKGAK